MKEDLRIRNNFSNLKEQMKIFKFIVFIPVCLLAIGIINFLFMQLLNWTIDRTTQWYQDISAFYFVLLIPLFWGIIWGIFKLSAIGLAALLIPISPNKNFSLYTLGLMSLVNCIALIIFYWTREVNYSWRVILMSMIITGFILDFSTSIVLVFSRKESHGFEE